MYKLFIHCLSVHVYNDMCKYLYLSNRPQVSMGYRLLNHAGCW